MDDFQLQRFVDAQDAAGHYDDALAELRAGEKRSHWMWFVFPQLVGLGRSATAQRYAISGLPEARAYLAHPVLGARLGECVTVLLAGPHQDPVRVFGPVDAMKLRSSMTLFARAVESDGGISQQAAMFQEVLDRYFGGEADEQTDRLLGRTLGGSG